MDGVAQALPVLGVWCVVAIKRLAAFGSSCAEDFTSNRTDCISQDFRFLLQLFLGQEGVGTRTSGKGIGTLGLDWIVQFCEHIMLGCPCVPICIFSSSSSVEQKLQMFHKCKQRLEAEYTDSLLMGKIFYLIEERFCSNYMAKKPPIIEGIWYSHAQLHVSIVDDISLD